MGTADRPFRSSQLAQDRARGAILPLIQQSGGGVAMPAVGMFEQGGELGRCGLAQPRLRGRCRSGTIRQSDPVDAARYVHLLGVLGRQERRALDELPAHVNGLGPAVGRVGDAGTGRRASRAATGPRCSRRRGREAGRGARGGRVTRLLATSPTNRLPGLIRVGIAAVDGEAGRAVKKPTACRPRRSPGTIPWLRSRCAGRARARSG